MNANKRKKHNRNWWPFEEAREYVRSLGLRNLSEWLAWAKSEERPGDIPANPSIIYKHRGWVDIGNWLGIDSIPRRGGNPCRKPRTGWRSFEEARKYVRRLGLKNFNEWRAWTTSGERPG